jgi:signal transduction histidine kinase
MKGRNGLWIPSFLRKRAYRSQEPGAALFRALRTRLTLWYSGVFGLALVVFCTILYLSAQYFLVTPIANDTSQHAQVHAGQWQSASFQQACLPQSASGPPGQGQRQGQGAGQPEMVACFSTDGRLLADESSTTIPTAFLNNNIVQEALRHGEAHDIVESSVGAIYRCALAVPSATGNGYIGVVVTGENVQAQEQALSLLLVLLLSVGGISLLGAGVGGLFLANRALEPARLAWTKQQNFIADASHELRTPLTLLRANAEVLLRNRERLDEEDAFLLEDIVNEVTRMTALTTNMLTLARLDNKTSQHTELEIVSLADLARGTIRRVQALAEEKRVSLQVEVDERAVVIGDAAMLEQATLVLLDNAVKYNREGGRITVGVTVQDGYAALEVEDTGIGIPAESLPHLGERFYRVDKARSREAGGTGLGLSIARRIADVHRGTLALSSVYGQGTRATLRLPLVVQ